MIQSSPAAGSGTQEALAILNDNPLGDLLFTDLLQPPKLETGSGYGPATAAEISPPREAASVRAARPAVRHLAV
jgi:hypothetical protein